jgi:hypothetical protein
MTDFGGWPRRGQKTAVRQLPIGTLRSWIYRLKREKAEEATAVRPLLRRSRGAQRILQEARHARVELDLVGAAPNSWPPPAR